VAASPIRPSTTAVPASRFKLPLEPAGESAVDEHDDAAHVRGALGAEERDDVADLARGAEPAEGDRREIVLGRTVRIHLADPLRVDAAGGEAVHRDSLRPEFACERLGPSHDS